MSATHAIKNALIVTAHPIDNSLSHTLAARIAGKLREEQRVERADMLVFVFPVYWWSVPALLKGWFDRVLTLNWAYKVADDGRIVGNLRDVPVRLIATGGSDLTGFDKHGYSTAIQTQIIEGVFGFCGLKNVKLDILYQADTATPEQVDEFLSKIGNLK
jgi:NAD(P)H dehydrogenase (quinone)